jgi:hypothetical protein
MKGAIKMFIFRCNNTIFMNVISVSLGMDANYTPVLKVKTSDLDTAIIKTYKTSEDALAAFNRICNELKIGKTYIEV